MKLANRARGSYFEQAAGTECRSVARVMMATDTLLDRAFKKRWREMLLVILVAVTIAPMLYHGVPVHAATPDVTYVRGKVLQVLSGDIFADPITDFDTMHPPAYHLFLALFAAVGLNLDTVMILVTVMNILLMVYFIYRIVSHLFNKNTALVTGLCLPLIMESMGPRYLLLATAFNFSAPFYLAGLWVYLEWGESTRRAALASALWGVAFLISPVYSFLIGLTFLYDIITHRRWRRFVAMLATFLIAIGLFIFQAVYVYLQGLWGASAFSLWRGVPGLDWWADLGRSFIAPLRDSIFNVGTAIYFVILLTAAVTVFRSRRIGWFIPISLAAYFLTYYHYSPEYATRIQMFFSIFVVATAVYGSRRLIHSRLARSAVLAAVVVFGVYQQVADEVRVLTVQQNTHAGYLQLARRLWENMDQHLEEDRYIFCAKIIYRQFLMPKMRLHTLGAYKTMDYFQLKSELAAMLEHDFRASWISDDYAEIEKIAEKYGINAAVVSLRDREVPLFATLATRWTPVYEDRFFTILKKPE